MRFSELKQDKGVAGLTILLSLVVMLFIIGLIVMIFALMGAELQEATYTVANPSSAVNESHDATQGTTITLNASEFRSGTCGTITGIRNGTVGSLIAGSDNFTQSGCVITNTSSTYSVAGTDVAWLVDYPYTWNSENVATYTINDTTQAITNVIDWFSIFIVIGAMVVLILLTVIIITAIRGSGMIQGGGTTPTGRANIGSA